METDIQYAGEFFIKELNIYCSSGRVIDMKNIQGLELYESMFTTSMSGNLVFLDVDNMTENGPIIGQEYMTLKIGTPGLEDFDIDAVFNINKVNVKQSASVGSELISLSFITPELLRSSRTRVSKSYTDTISNIVEDVLRNVKYINTKKRLIVEPTAGIRKVICPNDHPLKFITNLATEAISSSGNQNFIFFESTKGLQFRSIDSILNSDTIADYSMGDIGLLDNKTVDVEKDFQRPMAMAITQNNDMLLNTIGGMLGSKIIKYNIYNKTFETSRYGYFADFEGNNTIDSNPVYSENPIDEYGNTIGSFSDARIHVHPVSTNGTTDAQHTNETSSYSYAPIGTSNKLLQRQSKFLELNSGISITVKVNGNNTIAVGETVNISVPIVGKKHEESGDYDQYYSGKYVITTLKHQFDNANKRHITEMKVSKDSISTKLPIDSQSIEPFGGEGQKIELT